MHKHLITALFALACSGAAFAGTDKLPYKTDVVTDGINKEWEPHLPKYDSKTGINYEVANDERNLYFILRISDEATQRQILQNGLEVWINANGKKKKVTGVSFPLPRTKDSIKAKEGRADRNAQQEPQKQGDFPETNEQDGQRQRPSGANREMPIRSNELMLTGFLLENGKQPVKGCPVRVGISRDDSQSLIYELCVPFNTFYKETIDPSDAKVTFCFGFIIKSPEKSEEEVMRSMMRGSGGPGGMMGGPGGGMMGGPGGMMGGPGMDMGGQSASASTESDKALWFRAFLNTK